MARRKSEPKQPYRVARTRSERRKHSSECHQRQQTDGDVNQERGNVFAGPCNAFLLQENGGRPRHRGWECISGGRPGERARSEEHTSELQSLMRISYAVFCLKKKKT